MKKLHTAVLCALLAGGCANPINLKTASIYYDSALEAENRGDFTFAERQYDRALANARLGHAPEAGISAALYGLGRMKGYLCKFGEAEPLLLETLTLEDRVSGPDGANMTKRLFELSRFYADRGHYAQSLPYFAKAIPAISKLGVETSDPIAFADVLDDYSLALEKTGNGNEARKQQAQASDIRGRNPGRQATYIPKRYGQSCPTK